MKNVVYFFFELIERTIRMVGQSDPVSGEMINLTGAKQKQLCKHELILRSGHGEIRDLRRLRLR